MIWQPILALVVMVVLLTLVRFEQVKGVWLAGAMVIYLPFMVYCGYVNRQIAIEKSHQSREAIVATMLATGAWDKVTHDDKKSVLRQEHIVITLTDENSAKPHVDIESTSPETPTAVKKNR